jgi:hypothetical protein
MLSLGKLKIKKIPLKKYSNCKRQLTEHEEGNFLRHLRLRSIAHLRLGDRLPMLRTLAIPSKLKAIFHQGTARKYCRYLIPCFDN